MNNEISSKMNDTGKKVNEIPKKDFRDTIYGRMDVSVKTMDNIILVLFILLILSLIFGVIM